MNDFSTPRRMNAWALIILLQKSLRDIIALIFVLGFNIVTADSLHRQIRRTIISVVIITVVSVFLALSRYFFWKFHVEDNKLVFSHGFASKNTTSIPLTRIHTLRTKSGIFYRLLGLRGISFDTLASGKEEVELILDEEEWDALLCKVSMDEKVTVATETAAESPAPHAEEYKTLRVDDSDIIKGALCQNVFKGFVILAAFALALYNKISQFIDNAADVLISYIGTKAGGILQSTSELILFAAVVYLIVMIFWVGKIVLRYCGMILKISDSRLSMESGLLSRYTCRIPRDKATVLKIKQNPLEKMTHSQTISIRQAQNVTGNEKGGNIIIYGSDLGNTLFSWWIGNSGNTSEAPVISAKSGNGLIMRKFIPHLILATAIILLSLYTGTFVLPAIIICSAYAIVMAYGAVMAWKHSRITLTERYVKINSGRIAEIAQYIKYQDIESVCIRNSPFTSFTGRVSLLISTNAGAFSVKLLKIDAATAIRNLLLNKESRGYPGPI